MLTFILDKSDDRFYGLDWRGEHIGYGDAWRDAKSDLLDAIDEETLVVHLQGRGWRCQYDLDVLSHSDPE